MASPPRVQASGTRPTLRPLPPTVEGLWALGACSRDGEGGGMTTPRAASRTPEQRWPMALAVLTAIVLQVITPHTGRIVFWWVFPVLELATLAVLVIRDPGRIDRRTRAARRTSIVLVVLLTIGTLAALVVLTLDVVDKTYAPTVGATALLGRGLALWVTNVVVFSLWFWELDRGGAAERAAASPIRPSFGFPEDALPELVAEGWMPRYPDCGRSPRPTCGRARASRRAAGRRPPPRRSPPARPRPGSRAAGAGAGCRAPRCRRSARRHPGCRKPRRSGPARPGRSQPRPRSPGRHRAEGPRPWPTGVARRVVGTFASSRGAPDRRSSKNGRRPREGGSR